MSYFNSKDKEKRTIGILVGIIAVLIVVNLLAFRSILGIASNKTIVIQVPSVLESGEYAIGNSFASDNVYKMWTKVWIETVANYSYKNIRKRMEEIYPFLDPQTAMKSKAKIAELIKFVENNFITQSFSVEDILIEDVAGGLKRVSLRGKIKRTIGQRKDKLSGVEMIYEFILFVRNGQVYIKGINAYLLDPSGGKTKDILENIDSVNYSDLINSGSGESEGYRRDLKLKEEEEKRRAAERAQKGGNK